MSIGPVMIDAVRRSTSLPVDVHLMIVEPDRQLDRCVRSGASSITVHVEASHLHRVIQQIKDLGAKACVALNPATPLVTVEPMLGELDMVLLMTVNPGYAGQRFIPAVLPKVRQLREWIATHGLALDVQVDGGINESTAAQAVAAGANVLVAASAIFQSEGGIEASVRRLRQAALAAEIRK